MIQNSFGARDKLNVGESTFEIFRLDALDGATRLPYSLKVLLENLLRNEDGYLTYPFYDQKFNSLNDATHLVDPSDERAVFLEHD